MDEKPKIKVWMAFKPGDIKPGDAFSDVLVVSKEEEVESLFTLCIGEKEFFVRVHIPGGEIKIPYTAFVEGISRIGEVLKQPVLSKFPSDLSIEALWREEMASLAPDENKVTKKREASPSEAVEEAKREGRDGKSAELEQEREPAERGDESEDPEQTPERDRTQTHAPTLLQRIIDFAEGKEEVALESAYEFFADCPKSSVRSAFSKLQKKGVRERIGKGTYRFRAKKKENENEDEDEREEREAKGGDADADAGSEDMLELIEERPKLKNHASRT